MSGVSVPVRLPSSNGTRAMIATSSSRQTGNSSSSGVLVEDVVDDLHAVDEPGARARCSTLAGSQRLTLMPNARDELLSLQILDRALPALVVRPRVAPDVELLEVDVLDAEIPEALLGVSRRMWSAGYVSATGVSACAGHFMFFGGTFVATYSGACRMRASAPRRAAVSLLPMPYANAVSKKLQPSSNARSSACSDSSSSEPVQPPMPHMP